MRYDIIWKRNGKGERRVMNDLQLKYFLAAARYENFTKAAETMFIAQPVLGRHISNLEKELGFSLFERNRKSVRLTENGKLFAEFAQETLDRFDAMAHQVQENLRKTHMNLRIGSVDGQSVEGYFAPALKHILEERPNMQLSVSYYQNTEKMFDALLNGHIDAAITGFDVVQGRLDTLEFKRIRETRGCFIVPAASPLAQKESPTAEDFRNVRFILRSEEDNKLSHDLQLEIATRYGITDFVTAPNTKTLTMLVRSGVGITTVPDNYELCSDPGFRRIWIPNGHSFIEGLIWRKDNMNPAIPVFCEELEESGCCT